MRADGVRIRRRMPPCQTARSRVLLLRVGPSGRRSCPIFHIQHIVKNSAKMELIDLANRYLSPFKFHEENGGNLNICHASGGVRWTSRSQSEYSTNLLG